MEFFVPVHIREEFKGKYYGKIPCVPDYKVEGDSKSQVAEKMYKDISYTIQKTKDPRIFRTFLKDKDNIHFDLIKIDFFSRAEHFLFTLLLFLSSAFVFLVISTLLGYLGYLYLPVGSRPFNSDNAEFIASQYIWFHYAQAVVYVILFNVIYTYSYPGWLSKLAQVILESPTFRKFYQRWLSSWARPMFGTRLTLDWEKKNAQT